MRHKSKNKTRPLSIHIITGDDQACKRDQASISTRVNSDIYGMYVCMYVVADRTGQK